PSLSPLGSSPLAHGGEQSSPSSLAGAPATSHAENGADQRRTGQPLQRPMDDPRESSIGRCSGCPVRRWSAPFSACEVAGAPASDDGDDCSPPCASGLLPSGLSDG